MCENKANRGEKFPNSSTDSDQSKQTRGVATFLESNCSIFIYTDSPNQLISGSSLASHIQRSTAGKEIQPKGVKRTNLKNSQQQTDFGFHPLSEP